MPTRGLSGFGVFTCTIFLASALVCLAQENAVERGSQPRRTVVRPLPNRETGQDTPESTEMLSANFQATFYEVQAAADRVGSLDAKELARQAATPEELLKALSEIGSSRILYRIDQPVNVYSERITMGSSEPVVTATRYDSRGQAVNTVTYQNVGVFIRLSARKPAPESDQVQPDVLMSIQLAAMAPTSNEVGSGVKVPAMRKVSIDHSEPLEFNRPLVMLAVSSTSPSEQVTPAAYVVRYMFSAPVGR